MRRNQPCCIKNVKWFCTTLVERFESLTKLQYARHVTNGNRAAYSRCAWETVAFVGGTGAFCRKTRLFALIIFATAGLKRVPELHFPSAEQAISEL